MPHAPPSMPPPRLMSLHPLQPLRDPPPCERDPPSIGALDVEGPPLRHPLGEPPHLTAALTREGGYV